MAEHPVQETATAEVRPQAEEKTRTQRQPPYHVIIYNDEEHTFEYVIGMLQKLFGHSLERAFLLTREADATGRAVVCTTSLERAELKREQIHAFGADPLMPRSKGPVRASIEPAV